MPKKRKNNKSQKRRKYKRSSKLSRKKTRKGGMKETETSGLLDMSLLKSTRKLLDIDQIKGLYDSTFEYLKDLDESQMDEIKELINSQTIDEDKIKFLLSLNTTKDKQCI